MSDELEDSFLRAVAYVAPIEPSPLDEVKVGTVIGGRYLLEESIGRGGMAHVFAARHQVTGRRVALKWMLPERTRDGKAARRFVREARAIASIDHPNVVSVYDAGTHCESPYLVMELLQGQSLRARLREGPRPDVSEAIAVALAVIAGVREAHKRGILHRDIKPDNVFLCARPGERPLPKVLDFGVSCMLPESGELTTLTDHGTVVGTPGYMPLEQLQGVAELDPRADVYAVGVVLYEMLTGQRPFPARTYGELIVQLAMAEAPPPERFAAGIDDELSGIVMQAIARERTDRFADLDCMARALSAYPRRRGLFEVSIGGWRPALLVVASISLALSGEAARDPMPPALSPAPVALRAPQSPRAATVTPHEPARVAEILPSPQIIGVGRRPRHKLSAARTPAPELPQDAEQDDPATRLLRTDF